MEFRAPKPVGTFYSDYAFRNGFLWGVFEHDSRITWTRMAKIDEEMEFPGPWNKVEVEETEQQFIVRLPDAHCQPLLRTTV